MHTPYNRQIVFNAVIIAQIIPVRNARFIFLWVFEFFLSFLFQVLVFAE